MTPDQRKDLYERAQPWIQRWEKACQYYDIWEKRHQCKELANYYEGMQYPDYAAAPDGMSLLVFNLFFSAIEAKMPTLSFQKPVATIKPKPSKMDYSPDLAASDARLRTDLINTFLTDPTNGFADITEQAILDSQFRFGVVEVGYSAAWIDNPKISKPVLKTDLTDTDLPTSNKENLDTEYLPKEIPEEEAAYVKSIDPRQFRVGGNDNWDIEKANWYGYREIFREEDLLAIPAVADILDAKDFVPMQSSDFVEEQTTLDNSWASTTVPVSNAGDGIDCLVIYDTRRKVRMLIEKSRGIILQEIPYPRKRVFLLRFSKPATNRSAYPVPPAKSWKSPQDMYNNSRNAQKAYMARALQKYVAKEDAFLDDAELNKLTSPEPFTISMVKNVNDVKEAITNLPVPPLSMEFQQNLYTSREDFNFFAGTASDVQEVDRETATKSKIIATRSGIRESRYLGIVSSWLSEILAEICKIQQQNFTKEVWYKRSMDAEPTLAEAQNFETAWAKIDPVVNLASDFEFDVEIDIASLSPIYKEERKNKLLEFLAIINQYPQFAFSPKMLRWLAVQLDIRVEEIITELQNMALLQQMGMQQQAAAMMQQMQAPASESPMAQRTVAAATPPAQEQINNQLNNQVGIPVQ